MCPEDFHLLSNGSCSICHEGLFYYSDGCQKCQENYFLYPNDTCISTCPYPYIEDYTSSPLKQCKPFQSIAEIIFNVTQSAAMAATQVATALTSKSPGGVMVGIAGRIFFIIKFLNITRSIELEHALQTWKSNFVPIDFNFLMPSEMEENIPETPVPRIFEKRQVLASFLLNSWDNLIFILIIIVIFILLQILILSVKKDKYKWLRIIKRIKVSVQNYLITQLYAIYGDLIFYIILELRVIYLGNWTINLSFTIELILLLFIITSFTLHFLLLVKYQKIKKEAQNTNNKELLQQFQKDYEGVQMLFIDFKDDSLIHQAFIIYITSRDMLFSLVITTLFGLTLFQVTIFLLLNTSLLIYLILKRPFKERFEEIQQFTFEIIILTVNIIEIIGSTLDNMDSFGSNIQIVLGKLLIILNVGFNICALLFMIFKIVFSIKSAYQDYKQKKIVKRRIVTRIIRKHKQRAKNPIRSSQVNDISIIKTLKSRNDDISIQNLEL